MHIKHLERLDSITLPRTSAKTMQRVKCAACRAVRLERWMMERERSESVGVEREVMCWCERGVDGASGVGNGARDGPAEDGGGGCWADEEANTNRDLG